MFCNETRVRCFQSMVPIISMNGGVSIGKVIEEQGVSTWCLLLSGTLAGNSLVRRLQAHERDGFFNRTYGRICLVYF